LEGVLTEWMIIGTGTILLLFSAFCFIAGIWRYLLQIETPAPEAPKIPILFFVVFNGFLALVALVACFGLLLGSQR
jgi:putative membrane protein